MEDPEETFGGDGDASPAPYEELVSAMAGGLYGELERLVGAHGPGAVSGLLPQLVSVLEALQRSCGQVRDRDQSLEGLRDDRLRLLEQYERERGGRKRAEERFMELEDTMEQERKAHAATVARLEGQSRALEGKARSYADQVASLEDQKSLLLKELSALSQTHTKMTQSYRELKAQRVVLAGVGQTGSPSVETKRLKPRRIQEPSQFLPSTSDPGAPESPQPLEDSGENREPPCLEKAPQKTAGRNNCPLAQEMVQPEKAASPAREERFDLDEILRSTPELAPAPQLPNSPLNTTLERNTVSLFAEVSGLSPEIISDMDDGADLQGDGLETLMAENAQLQEARIALDTARRHLIARVEELTEDRESLRMEREVAMGSLSRCQTQLKEAELELNRIRQELEETRRPCDDGEAEVAPSRPQRFTRAEMARVVMERNLYKERLMELQEAVRRTELLRASREEQAVQMKKSSFWKIFDRLFSPLDAPEKAPASPLLAGRARSSPSLRGELGRNGGQASPALRYIPRATSPTEADSSPQQKRRELYRDIRSHIWQEHGRGQIHGWSQPPALQGQDPPVGGAEVPVLVQLRMLDQKDPSTKLWCAAASVGMELQGTPEALADVPTPGIFQGTFHPQGAPSQCLEGSSRLWVASGTHSASEIMLFDAQNPNQLLEHFVLPGIHILSLVCVPGLMVPGRESPELEPEILEDPLAPGSDSEDETLEMEAADTEPTVWFGTQEGCIHIHSAKTDWRRCQGKAQLKDAVHCIVHSQGRVAATLGDGSVAIFHRNPVRKWDLRSPRLVDLGRPRRSIRCAIPVLDRLWCGYGNRIYVLDLRAARIQRYFEVTSHPESQVRHMVAAGSGIWVSVRLDSVLRLLHAETGQPLQEVELGPYISRMLGPSSLSLALNITALGAFGKRLWVGTSGGTVLSLPFVSEAAGSSGSPAPAGIPYCAMEQAQISYHGHRDAVRFFVTVPGCMDRSSSENPKETHEKKPRKPCSLVLSGGEGYINLRIGDDTDERYGDLLLPNPRLRRAERSHLIVWQVQA
ncbi:C-Jun-amino-terminal kinase-interacting protein 4-like isoform X1 [Sphaerodactylus townsendi]|uniref:C-Jun-amino-terminal kinase-interacting protein 4-like isoform X1 n=1 Tax=Sphaerodactylus townsendi TaxID=933632 RepID=UPI002026383E|nr:C-Jun-amino-terminal kinase-interacting protein 4-like isoform X1 [Sphaerodactylus townsendi]